MLNGPAGDEEEWRAWQAKGDPVQHIELRKWADILVIAPLSANTLAKMAQGLCDNCLTSVVRAWDWSKPLLVSNACLGNDCGNFLTSVVRLWDWLDALLSLLAASLML